MDLLVDMAFVVTVILVMVRLSALFLLTPLFATAQVPVQIRVLFLLPLAATLVASLSVTPVTVPLSLAELIQMMVAELLLGAILAFGLFAAFGAFLLGGRILDFQMGFGVANLIDPSTNSQAPMLGTVLNIMAVTTFFLLDGHHMLIRGLKYSLEKVPPGSALAEMPLDAVVSQFGVMFIYGLMLVAPAVFALLMLDVGMAVAARTMPQVNMFIVGLPLKIFVGLVVLAMSLNYMSPLLQRIYKSIFQYWERVLA